MYVPDAAVAAADYDAPLTAEDYAAVFDDDYMDFSFDPSITVDYADSLASAEFRSEDQAATINSAGMSTGRGLEESAAAPAGQHPAATNEQVDEVSTAAGDGSGPAAVPCDGFGLVAAIGGSLATQHQADHAEPVAGSGAAPSDAAQPAIAAEAAAPEANGANDFGVERALCGAYAGWTESDEYARLMALAGAGPNHGPVHIPAEYLVAVENSSEQNAAAPAASTELASPTYSASPDSDSLFGDDTDGDLPGLDIPAAGTQQPEQAPLSPPRCSCRCWCCGSARSYGHAQRCH